MMLTEKGTIAPHGGKLVDRAVPAGERGERLKEAAGFLQVRLGPRTLSNLEMISTGVFSPLEGFMGREDYDSVVGEMRFPDGLPWSMPVTLPTDEETANSLTEGSEISLVDGIGEIVATMTPGWSVSVVR